MNIATFESNKKAKTLYANSDSFFFSLFFFAIAIVVIAVAVVAIVSCDNIKKPAFKVKARERERDA